jgi:hypothetical protein
MKKMKGRKNKTPTDEKILRGCYILKITIANRSNILEYYYLYESRRQEWPGVYGGGSRRGNRPVILPGGLGRRWLAGCFNQQSQRGEQ